MSGLSKITTYLEKYEDLFLDFQEAEITFSYPFMPTFCELINDENYYGCDFRNNNKVYMLFYNGASNYFAGIVVPDDKKHKKFDEYPVYIFDLQSDKPVVLVGNFKTYMKENFSAIKTKKSFPELKSAISDLDKFSNKLITCKYTLKLSKTSKS